MLGAGQLYIFRNFWWECLQGDHGRNLGLPRNWIHLDGAGLDNPCPSHPAGWVRRTSRSLDIQAIIRSRGRGDGVGRPHVTAGVPGFLGSYDLQARDHDLNRQRLREAALADRADHQGQGQSAGDGRSRRSAEILAAPCLAEYNRAILFANFHSYDTGLSICKGRQRVISCGFLGIEGRHLRDAPFPVPDHRVGHCCGAPSIGALILPASNSTGASSPLTAA